MQTEIPKITVPTLVTAYSAVQEGDRPGKKLRAIDGNWRTKGTYFADKPAKLTVTFHTPIDWLDVTVNNADYGAAISLKGMGFEVSDVRDFIPPERGRHTYRFKLPQQTEGELVFETNGGSGKIELHDISGFILI